MPSWRQAVGVITRLKHLARSKKGTPWLRFDLVCPSGDTLRVTAFYELAAEADPRLKNGMTVRVFGRADVYRRRENLVVEAIFAEDGSAVCSGDATGAIMAMFDDPGAFQKKAAPPLLN